MIKRQILTAAFCAAFVLGGAGAALAGEVTGNGKSLKPLNGKSNCAFSGLEDDIDTSNQISPEVDPGTVQNFGHSGPSTGSPPNNQGPAAPGTQGVTGCNPSENAHPD